MLDQIVTFNKKLSRLLSWIGGIVLVLAAALVSIDVIARKLLNVSMAGADEIAGYALAISLSFGLSFALFQRAHIRIDIVAQSMPFKIRAVLDLIAMLAFTVFIGVLSYYAFNLVSDTFSNGSRSVTPLQTPLIIPQSLWLFGFLLCGFCGTMLFLAAIVKLRRKDFGGFEALIGVKTIDEEIAEEVFVNDCHGGQT